MDGHLFLFRGRNGDRLKILHWDKDGFCLWYKRLEQGVFKLPPVPGEAKSVELRGSEWHLVNLPVQPGRAGKNITQLDGRDMAVGASVPLAGEHVLKMSSQCEVKLRVASV